MDIGKRLRSYADRGGGAGDISEKILDSSFGSHRDDSLLPVQPRCRLGDDRHQILLADHPGDTGVLQQITRVSRLVENVQRHHHPTRLDDAEPAEGKLRAISQHQTNPLARLEAVGDERVGDLIATRFNHVEAQPSRARAGELFVEAKSRAFSPAGGRPCRQGGYIQDLVDTERLDLTHSIRVCCCDSSRQPELSLM